MFLLSLALPDMTYLGLEKNTGVLLAANRDYITKLRHQGYQKTGKVIQKTTRRSLQRAKRGYISDHLANNIKDNPKTFWTFVKKTKSEEVGISDLKVNNSGDQ